jgi:hypothetical protein
VSRSGVLFARWGGDHAVTRTGIDRVVDAHAEDDVLVLGGSGDHNLPRSGLEMCARGWSVIEVSCRLDHDVHAEIFPWQLPGIPLGKDCDDVAVHLDAASIDRRPSPGIITC